MQKLRKIHFENAGLGCRRGLFALAMTREEIYVSPADLQSMPGIVWHATQEFFAAPQWTAAHGVALMLAAGTILMWLVASWPLQVKVLGSVTAAMLMLTLLLGAGTISTNASMARAQERASAEIGALAHRAFDPFAGVGTVLSAASDATRQGIAGMLGWLRG
jgi:hypothetical protein